MTVPLIAIGTSKDGLNELEDFFKHLPKLMGLAFVIIQEYSGIGKGFTAESLARITRMEVTEIQNDSPLKPGKIYLSPSNQLLTLEAARLVLNPIPENENHPFPINTFFRSMKNQLKEKAIGVLLSGNAKDGILSLAEINDLGGLSLIHDSQEGFDEIQKITKGSNLKNHLVKIDEMPGLIKEHLEKLEFQTPNNLFPGEGSEQETLQIFENTNDHIYILNVEEGNRFKIIATNPKLKETFGKLKEGEFVDQCLDQESFKILNAQLCRCLKERKAIFFDDKLESKILNTQLIPLMDESNKIYRIIGVARNVTEQVLTEKALQKTKTLLIEAEKQAGIGNWSWNPTQGKLDWSDGAGFIFNFPEGQHPLSLDALKPYFNLNDFKAFQKALENSAGQGDSIDMDVKIKQNGGTERYCHIKGQGNRNASGNIDLVFGTILDVHERTLAEEKLKENESRFKKISELAVDYTYSYFINPDQSLSLDWSFGAIERITGYSAKELIEEGKIHQIIHPDDRELKLSVSQSLMKGEEVDEIIRIHSKNGDLKYIRDRSYPKREAPGKPVHKVVGMFIEVTRQKLAEIELLKAKQKAEENDKLKSAFLANMSHEIRTPMNGVVGFAQLLKRKGLSKSKRDQYVNIIQDNSKELLQLINDIIDVSKIEAGQLSIKEETYSPHKILNDLFLVFKEIKNQKGKEEIDLALNLPEGSENIFAESDPDRIKQVLSNLLSNALKFTKKGTIEFGFKIENDRIHFFVIDTGIGIAKKDQKVIFNRFEQLINNANQSFHEGTGLGLSIVRGIVTLLGGSIRLDSSLGMGSLFEFHLPFIPASSNTKPAPKKDINLNVLKGKTILIAEDNHTNTHLFKEFFKDIPMELIFAGTGKEAIEMVEKRKDIDLILMDIRMPELSGLEATKQLLSVNPDLKIIAQSAYALSHEKDYFLQEGFIDYISKPLDREVLLGMLVKWLSRS